MSELQTTAVQPIPSRGGEERGGRMKGGAITSLRSTASEDLADADAARMSRAEKTRIDEKNLEGDSIDPLINLSSMRRLFLLLSRMRGRKVLARSPGTTRQSFYVPELKRTTAGWTRIRFQSQKSS